MSLDSVPVLAEKFRMLASMPIPKLARKTVDPVSRFVQKTKVCSGGCIEWTGGITPQGYGLFSWGSKPTLAHRWAYEAARGTIPAGLVIDHLCRNRACVNPDHLECVAMAENTRRGILLQVIKTKAKQQTHCKRGHPLFGPNVRMTADDHRECRTCQRAAATEWKIRNRDRVNQRQRARRALEM